MLAKLGSTFFSLAGMERDELLAVLMAKRKCLGLVGSSDGGDGGGRAAADGRGGPRLERLAAVLLSPAVQAQAPTDAEEVPAELDAEGVAKVFEGYVPEVRKLVYRQQNGVRSIDFIQKAYADGLTFFKGSEVHDHLLWLMRRIVHYGRDGLPGSSAFMRELAEAFTDCQAVQARAIEHVGLQINGVALDFRGHLVRLAGEYKMMAVKMLSLEEVTKLGGPDSNNDPAHYDNRLIADIGDMAGVDKALVRQAHLDSHAKQRFKKLSPKACKSMMSRLTELFDVKAFVKAFAAEAGGFSESSPADSLPRTFLAWVSENMTHKHVVFDEDTCTRVEVGDDLALAVLETVFLGHPSAPPEESYRGSAMQSLFGAPAGTVEALVKDWVSKVVKRNSTSSADTEAPEAESNAASDASDELSSSPPPDPDHGGDEEYAWGL